MNEDRELIHEEIDHQGFLEFCTIASPPDGGIGLPEKFIAHITAELTPADSIDPGVIISVS